MAKHHNDQMLIKPLPDPRVPWFVIICLLAALVLVYLGFLREPNKLIGPLLPKNGYSVFLKQPPAPPAAQPSPAPAGAAQ